MMVTHTKESRAELDPELQEQLDLLYHDMAANKGDKTDG